MVESQCAVLLCSDSAQKVVVDFVEEHDREPLKAELFALLEQNLLGSVCGDLTVCKKVAILHCDDLTRILKARMTKGQIAVNLPSVLNLAKSELKLRPVQLDSASHVLWILSLIRDLSEGKRINHDLASIRWTAEKYMCGGICVEQMDPIAMLKRVVSCGAAWDYYYSTVLSKPSGGDSGGGSGGGSGGASGSGQSSQFMSSPRKRPFTAANQTAGRSVDRQPAGSGGVARQLFDPFVSIPSQCVVDRNDGNRKCFVRGQSPEAMNTLMKEGKCVLCKQAGHMMAACTTRQAMFAAKKFCFYPSRR
jgi:hypothetical protein